MPYPRPSEEEPQQRPPLPPRNGDTGALIVQLLSQLVEETQQANQLALNRGGGLRDQAHADGIGGADRPQTILDLKDFNVGWTLYKEPPRSLAVGEGKRGGVQGAIIRGPFGEMSAPDYLDPGVYTLKPTGYTAGFAALDVVEIFNRSVTGGATLNFNTDPEHNRNITEYHRLLEGIAITFSGGGDRDIALDLVRPITPEATKTAPDQVALATEATWRLFEATGTEIADATVFVRPRQPASVQGNEISLFALPAGYHLRLTLGAVGGETVNIVYSHRVDITGSV